jgi:hypothetical protein
MPAIAAAMLNTRASPVQFSAGQKLAVRKKATPIVLTVK